MDKLNEICFSGQIVVLIGRVVCVQVRSLFRICGHIATVKPLKILKLMLSVDSGTKQYIL